MGYVIFIFKTNISSKRMCEAEPCLISRTQKKYLKTPFKDAFTNEDPVLIKDFFYSEPR